MSHTYKKVPPKKPATVSYVAAVKQWGDNWKLAFPALAPLQFEDIRRDQHEAALMGLMERGYIPRVGV